MSLTQDKINMLFDLIQQIEDDNDFINNEDDFMICDDETLESSSLHYPETTDDIFIKKLYRYIKKKSSNTVFPLFDNLTIEDLYSFLLRDERR
jgi:hypothetical protein